MQLFIIIIIIIIVVIIIIIIIIIIILITIIITIIIIIVIIIIIIIIIAIIVIIIIIIILRALLLVAPAYSVRPHNKEFCTVILTMMLFFSIQVPVSKYLLSPIKLFLCMFYSHLNPNCCNILLKAS